MDKDVKAQGCAFQGNRPHLELEWIMGMPFFFNCIIFMLTPHDL